MWKYMKKKYNWLSYSVFLKELQVDRCNIWLFLIHIFYYFASSCWQLVYLSTLSTLLVSYDTWRVAVKNCDHVGRKVLFYWHKITLKRRSLYQRKSGCVSWNTSTNDKVYLPQPSEGTKHSKMQSLQGNGCYYNQQKWLKQVRTIIKTNRTINSLP